MPPSFPTVPFCPALFFSLAVAFCVLSACCCTLACYLVLACYFVAACGLAADWMRVAWGRLLLGKAGLVGFGVLMGWGVVGDLQAGRPNVVLIMADDMGYECVGANGSQFYKTPNLDRLAAGGIRFEHAYSQPICTPSRVQIMTGRYNGRNYVRFGFLHPKEITFGTVMKQAGYRTCVAGKWQLKGGFEGPSQFGFEEYCLWQLTRRPSRYPNPGLEINGKQLDYTNGEYGPDIVSDYLVKFIHKNKDRPFFAYYPMILPHWPFGPTPDSPKYDPSNKALWKNKNTGDFAGMVAYVDKLVGKVDQALEEAGVRQNTLLIFTADNGTYNKVVSPFQGRDYRGGKGSTTNAGTHVAMIASWPGTIAPGQVSQDLIDFSDILPTLAELGNAKLPEDRQLDGRSFLPQLKGKTGNPRQWVACWYSRNGIRQPGKVKRFARNQTYKLYQNGRFYKISQDLLEEHDLSSAEIDPSAAQVQTDLRKVLEKLYLQEQEYPYSKDAQ